MPLVTRELPVTQGNIGNHHLYLTEVEDIFPRDVLGGPNADDSAPAMLRVHWGNEFVDTDIVRDKHIFRKRGWVGRFFSDNRIKEGDIVLLEQLDTHEYRVSKKPDFPA